LHLTGLKIDSNEYINRPGVSLLIPSIRNEINLRESLETICISTEAFPLDKEIILAVDREILATDPYYELAKKYPFIKIIVNTDSKGGPFARRQALLASQYRTLIFADDDCWVPKDWVSRLYALVQIHGVVTGLVQGRSNNLIDRCEALIDRYRIAAKDSGGHAKFLSFPNFGIHRELLPENPFDAQFRYNLGSLDLGNQLRLQGWNIFADPTLVIFTEYPKTFAEAVSRKFRHARGIAFVHHRLGHEAWTKLEMGSHALILWRWTKISFTAPLKFSDRCFFFILNMCYAVPLMTYYYLSLIKSLWSR
jgi:cellulose synthase/poly-beta-1,6-N-acetylglucosamine synthase-like glycosyltransferase